VTLQKRHCFSGKTGQEVDRLDRESVPFYFTHFCASLEKRKRVLAQVSITDLQALFGGRAGFCDGNLVLWFENEKKKHPEVMKVEVNCRRHIWAPKGECPVCNQPNMFRLVAAFGHSIHPNMRVETKDLGDGVIVCRSAGRRERFEGGETVEFAFVVDNGRLDVIVESAFGGYGEDNISPLFSAINRWQNPTMEYLSMVDDRVVTWAGDLLVQPGDGRCWWSDDAPWAAHNNATCNHFRLHVANIARLTHEDCANLVREVKK